MNNRHQNHNPRQSRYSALGLLLALAFWLAGCASDPNPSGRYIFPEERVGVVTDTNSGGSTPPFIFEGGAYSSVLRPGDLIIVTFSDMDKPIPVQSLNIPEGGVITLPWNVHVQATGKSTTELEKSIRDAYVPALFVNLTVTVRTERRAFYVDGEVKQPGQKEYFTQMTVLRAIGTAGGFTDFANRKKIELRRPGGKRLIVNYYKALEEPSFDIPVYPSDHIIVKRTVFFW